MTTYDPIEADSRPFFAESLLLSMFKKVSQRKKKKFNTKVTCLP
jgi:hypothetical protein